MSTSLDQLFSPRSVAIVGASDTVARIGGRPLRYLRESGFSGAVYPVNPSRSVVQGLRSYPSLADLPEAPDVAILAVPADATLSAVQDCVSRGVRNAVVFSAGFAEAGNAGAEIQRAMVAAAQAGGMRLLGPNCLGVFNPRTGFYGTFSVVLDTALMTPGSVGIVSQSGAYGAHVAHLARERGLGISYWATTGNECDIDVAEALAWMVAQPETKVIMAYAEGIRRPELFKHALHQARLQEKAIVFLKTGRSEVGAEAAASHTASLAGSDEVFSAVLRQFNVHRAATTFEQLDVAYACARGQYPRGNRIGIFTMSGGFGIQLADDSEAAGLDVAAMPDAAQAELKAILPYSSPRNPVDATAQVVTDMPTMSRYVRTMLDKGGYDSFAAILGTGPASATFSDSLRTAISDAATGHPGIVRALTMSAPVDVVRTYEKDGFLVYDDGSRLATSLGALARIRAGFDRARQSQPLAPGLRLPLPAETPGERGAKEILSRIGVKFPRELLVAPGDDAGSAAEQLGFPVAIKIASPDILHKTEIGGVALNVGSAEAARKATSGILARAAERVPDARIEGVIVSPMVSGGVECIVGAIKDPLLGPTIMFGLGGIFVEVLRDVAFRAAPFDIDEAHRMIREIRGFPLLQGARGTAPADVDALAELLSGLSRFAAAHSERVESIDLNPVRVMPSGQGVVALDALIVLSKPE